MFKYIGKFFEDKREWKRMKARTEFLPREYRIVYEEIMHYMFMRSGGDGMDVVAILRDLLAMFETGAAEGKPVLEITGEDVASFCDEMLRSAKTFTGNWHDALNRDIQRKLRIREDEK